MNQRFCHVLILLSTDDAEDKKSSIISNGCARPCDENSEPHDTALKRTRHLNMADNHYASSSKNPFRGSANSNSRSPLNDMTNGNVMSPTRSSMAQHMLHNITLQSPLNDDLSCFLPLKADCANDTTNASHLCGPNVKDSRMAHENYSPMESIHHPTNTLIHPTLHNVNIHSSSNDVLNVVRPISVETICGNSVALNIYNGNEHTIEDDDEGEYAHRYRDLFDDILNSIEEDATSEGETIECADLSSVGLWCGY